MEFQDVVMNRRAVNYFDPEKDVSDEQIRQMVEMAAQAPSSFNLQPWHLILLRSREDKMRLRKNAWDQAKVSEAPVTMIVLADMSGWKPENRFLQNAFENLVKVGQLKEEQKDWFLGECRSLYGETEARQVAFANKNTGFFAMNLMLAAKSMGIDTHPMDGFDLEAVKKEFKIPAHYWVPLLLAVGYFRQEMTLFPANGASALMRLSYVLMDNDFCLCYRNFSKIPGTIT